MDPNAIIAAVSFMLAFTGFVFRTGFLSRLKSGLLGYEWYILGFSASNAGLHFVTGKEAFLNVTLFCDAFSRIVGIPVIGTLGVMEITHRLKLSAKLEFALFFIGAVVAGLMLSFENIYALLPVGSFVIGLAFTWVLVVLSYQLFRAGDRLQGTLTAISTAALVFVSLTDGIFALPNPNNVIWLDFWFYSTTIWALAFAQIFYAYRSLEQLSGKHA